MTLTQRRETYKTLAQTLQGEPTPHTNSKDDVVEYIRRLMLKLSSGNLLHEIELETTLANAVVRAQVIAILPSYLLCRLIDGDTTSSEPTSPTSIKTLSDLDTLVRDNPTGHFKLANDINATALTADGGAFWNAGKGWDPLGNRIGEAKTGGFSGFFDGNGKTITGLFIARSDEDYVGLFGFCGTGSVIKNLTLKDIDITGATNVGGLVGNSYATISDCHITGTSTVDGGNAADNDDVGGLIGDNDGWLDKCTSAATVHGMFDVGGLAGDNDFIITNSSATGDVYGCQQGDVGGLVGDNKGFKENVALSDNPQRGTITNCFATGDVYSEDTVVGAAEGDIGGLVGDNRGGTISSSYATGDVVGKQPDIGGLVGSNKQGDNLLSELKDSIISNCFALGDVTPLGNLTDEGDCGGLVGDNQAGQVFNSYCANTVNITGGVNDREDKGDFCGDNTLGSVIGSYYNSDLAGIGSTDGGTSKTTAEMKKEATFVNWDFTDIWTIIEDTSYPTLPDNVVFYDNTIVDVYPVTHTGQRALSADVRPKITAGMILHAVKTPGGVYYTPTVFQDYNFPVGRDDIEDYAVGKDALGDINGADILGTGLEWNDTTEKVDVDLSVLELESTRFELAFNKASDADLTDEYGAIGTGGQPENAIFGQSFDPDADTAVVWSGFIPLDYKDGTDIVIKCRWCLSANGDVGATAWRWHSVWNKVDAEDDSVIGTETVSGDTDEAVGAAEPQRTLHTITLATISTLDIGDLLSVSLIRDAIHANDTCTKKVMVLDKIWAEYTLSMRYFISDPLDITSLSIEDVEFTKDYVLSCPTGSWINALVLQRENTANATRLNLYPAVGAIATTLALMSQVTDPAETTNLHRLIFINNGTATSIISLKSGSANALPLSIYTEGNTTQLVLNVDGTVSFGNQVTMSSGLGVSGLVDAGSLCVGGNIELEDGGYIGTATNPIAILIADNGDITFDGDYVTVEGDFIVDGLSHFGLATNYTTINAGIITQYGNSTASLNATTITGDLTVNTTDFVVDSVNHRVGIGTASPSYVLDIDAGEIGDNNYDGLRIVDTGWKAVSHPMLEFYNSNALFNGSLARIYGEIGNVGTNSKLYFAVADSSKNLQDRMVIDKGGNVGIGLTTVDANYKLIIRRATNINLGIGLIGSELAIAAFNDALSANIPMRFYASEYNLLNGNVGINTEIPAAKFQVVGTSRFGNQATNYTAITASGHLTLNGDATVWQDIQFSVSTAKVPASNAPTWAIFGANTKKFTFAENDYIDLEANETSHAYKEGSDCVWHLHLFTNGSDGTERTVKYQIDFGITNPDGVYSESSQSLQVAIPASTADMTHIEYDLYTVTGTNIDHGADITVRFTRIGTDTGTDPSGDPFISMLGLHIECNTIGSSGILTK